MVEIAPLTQYNAKMDGALTKQTIALLPSRAKTAHMLFVQMVAVQLLELNAKMCILASSTPTWGKDVTTVLAALSSKTVQPYPHVLLASYAVKQVIVPAILVVVLMKVLVLTSALQTKYAVLMDHAR